MRTPATDLDPNRPNALNEFWRDAFNAGDLATLMSTYEPDALIVPGPGAEPLRGHDAIAGALQRFLGLGGTLSFTPRHWLVSGDIAFSSCAFTMDGGTDAEGNPVDLRGVTAEVLRRQPDGSWKYLIDHPFGGSD
ncbi:YybH family protein [uncultured Jatrophihabitans sp.]|uniref:YybH family protein n=1 Tax=uncultured Jatrophihabitans sp. TaxID=1610747 RepID=UPI0035CC3955